MAQLIEPGNKNIFGATSPQASESREDMIISKTKTLAFPSAAVISLENFESYGGGGGINTVDKMVSDCGKSIQESYRIGLSESAQYTEKVADR